MFICMFPHVHLHVFLKWTQNNLSAKLSNKNAFWAKVHKKLFLNKFSSQLKFRSLCFQRYHFKFCVVIVISVVVIKCFNTNYIKVIKESIWLICFEVHYHNSWQAVQKIAENLIQNIFPDESNDWCISIVNVSEQSPADYWSVLDQCSDVAKKFYNLSPALRSWTKYNLKFAFNN